jgi:hypothetical protein
VKSLVFYIISVIFLFSCKPDSKSLESDFKPLELSADEIKDLVKNKWPTINIASLGEPLITDDGEYIVPGTFYFPDSESEGKLHYILIKKDFSIVQLDTVQADRLYKEFKQ